MGRTDVRSPTGKGDSGQPRSALAARAIEGRAAALDDSLRPSRRKRTAGPPGRRRRSSWRNSRACRRDWRSRARTSRRRRPPRQGLAGSRRPGARAGQARSSRRRGRMDAGAKQRLAGVDVAEPGDDPLVEEQRLDRRPAPFEAAPEPARVEVGAQGVGAERNKRRPVASASVATRSTMPKRRTSLSASRRPSSVSISK